MKEVQKFGGTSVDRLDQIISVIQERKEFRPFVCVSAFSGITDKLLALITKAENKQSVNNEDIAALEAIHMQKIADGVADEHIRTTLQNEMKTFFESRTPHLLAMARKIQEQGMNTIAHDQIMGFGEQASAFVIAAYLSIVLESEGMKGKFIDLGELIESSENKANTAFFEALKKQLQSILSEVKENEIAILTGFIGNIPGGILYSIDRGYTDYCGALTASVLGADRFIIFKEVDGVCSTDPRIVTEDCLLLKELSYTEVLKMASAGMKAVNTEAVKPAMLANIPMEVRNTFHPQDEGTKILAKRDMHPDRIIQNISIKKGVCIVRFGGFTVNPDENLELALMNLLEKHQIKKFFSTTDYAGTSVVIPYDEKKVEALLGDLNTIGNVKINKDCAIVAIIGEEMRNRVGVIAKATAAIAQTETSIHMVAQGASQIGIDFVIDEEKVNTAVGSIHKAFFNHSS